MIPLPSIRALPGPAKGCAMRAVRSAPRRGRGRGRGADVSRDVRRGGEHHDTDRHVVPVLGAPGDYVGGGVSGTITRRRRRPSLLRYRSLPPRSPSAKVAKHAGPCSSRQPLVLGCYPVGASTPTPQCPAQQRSRWRARAAAAIRTTDRSRSTRSSSFRRDKSRKPTSPSSQHCGSPMPLPLRGPRSIPHAQNSVRSPSTR